MGSSRQGIRMFRSQIVEFESRLKFLREATTMNIYSLSNVFICHVFMNRFIGLIDIHITITGIVVAMDL